MLDYFSMTDKIFLQGLKIPCLIGTRPRERKKKQPVVIDLEFPAPVRFPASTDDLRRAVDYQNIATAISTFVGRSRFFLLETLTERLAAMLLEKFRLRSVTLKVTKPGALPGSTGVAVRITRKR